MNETNASQNQIYTRAEFSRFFRQKHVRLLKSVFNKNERRPDYADPAVIEGIAAPYRQFAQNQQPQDLPATPRHIWMLWQQGWECAPPLVQACAQSWKQLNPGWELHLVDEAQLGDLAPAYNSVIAPKASRTAKANIARLSLLQEHGGVWADSTLFCQQPLDDWLPKVMGAGFFMFNEPRPYRYSDIWFLASAPHTQLISAWLEMVTQYWQHFKRPHHYYWMEYLFELLAARNPEIAATWQQVPKLSALGPLVAQGLPFDPSVPREIFTLIEQGIIPVHKLSHKWRFAGNLDQTPVGRLTGLQYL